MFSTSTLRCIDNYVAPITNIYVTSVFSPFLSPFYSLYRLREQTIMLHQSLTCMFDLLTSLSSKGNKVPSTIPLKFIFLSDSLGQIIAMGLCHCVRITNKKRTMLQSSRFTATGPSAFQTG